MFPSASNYPVLLNIDEELDLSAAAVALVATLIEVPIPFHITFLPYYIVGVSIVTTYESILFVVVHVSP